MNISIISTSPRKKSNSLRFAKFLQHTLKAMDFEEVSLVDFENYDIPFFGQGFLNKDNLSGFQQHLIGTWGKADLVFIVMPEYNWFPDAELINAINQLGGPAFGHLFNDKTFALAGVSSGRGGKMPAIEMSTMLNKVINFTQNYSIVSPRLYESHETPTNIDENGLSTGNEVYETSVKAFVDYALKVAKRWKG